MIIEYFTRWAMLNRYFSIDFELLKTIAAFGGFLISFVLALIQIYEKFIAKPRLVVDVEYSGLRRTDNSVYFKVDLSVVVLGGDVSLKEVFILNEVNLFKKRKLHFRSLFYHPSGQGDWRLNILSPIKKIPLDKAIKGQRLFYTGDINELNRDDFNEQFINQWLSTQSKDWEENIRGLTTIKYSRVLFTFVGDLTLPEVLSNHVQIPVKG